MMPMIIQEADALVSALDAIKSAQPIGDGIGPMVAGKFMLGKEKIEIDRETIYAKTQYRGKNLLVMNPKGPLGYVVRPHTGIEKLIGDPGNHVNALIIVDTALRLEGEKTGEVAKG